MPTPEEIKKIAREFAEYSLSEEKKMYDDETYQRLVDESSKGLFNVRYILQWLFKDYCIVEKGVLKERYKESELQSMSNSRIHMVSGTSRMILLESLFGKELFKEE